jgi:hypothetical protein
MDSTGTCFRPVHGRGPGGVGWQRLCQCTRFGTCHSLRIRSSWMTGCLLRRTEIACPSWGIPLLNGCLYLCCYYYFSETLGADFGSSAATDSDEFLNDISSCTVISYSISRVAHLHSIPARLHAEHGSSAVASHRTLRFLHIQHDVFSRRRKAPAGELLSIFCCCAG